MSRNTCLWAQQKQIWVSKPIKTRVGEIGEESFMVMLIPVIAGAFIIVLLSLMIMLIVAAKRKRSLHGSYNPQKEEFQSPILEMTEIFKEPPLERLI